MHPAIRKTTTTVIPGPCKRMQETVSSYLQLIKSFQPGILGCRNALLPISIQNNFSSVLESDFLPVNVLMPVPKQCNSFPNEPKLAVYLLSFHYQVKRETLKQIFRPQFGLFTGGYFDVISVLFFIGR